MALDPKSTGSATQKDVASYVTAQVDTDAAVPVAAKVDPVSGTFNADLVTSLVNAGLMAAS